MAKLNMKRINDAYTCMEVADIFRQGNLYMFDVQVINLPMGPRYPCPLLTCRVGVRDSSKINSH